MDYKEKVIVLLNSQELSKEQKEKLESIFPELKESEDERIRKAIIEHFEGSHSSMYPYKGFTKEQILAWLEKQGEQKTEVKYVYTKFQIGDTIVEIKPNGYCQPVRVKYIGDGAYSCESDDGKRSLSFPIINQDDYELVEQKHAWSEEDEYCRHQLIVFCENCMVQDDGAKRCAHWLKSIKDRIQPQSQSDERYRLLGKLKEWLDEYVSNLADVDTATLICSFTNYLDGKLPKSLRPQNIWKPSDEQMDALHYVTNFDYGGHKATLVSLYEQLKKLKG